MLGRGNALLALERFEEAVASYDKALSVRPDNADCHAGRGLALHALKRFDAALASYDKALAINPDNGDAWFGRGNALHATAAIPGGARELRQGAGDQARLRRSLLRPRAGRCRRCKRFDDALADFDAALAMKPFFADCLYSYGNALRELNRLEDAVAAFERLLDFAPDHAFLKGMLLYTKMFCCDWDRFAFLADAVKWDIEAGQKVSRALRLPGDFKLRGRPAALCGNLRRRTLSAREHPSVVRRKDTTTARSASATCPANSATRRRRS